MQGSGPDQSSSVAFFGPVVLAWAAAFVGLVFAPRVEDSRRRRRITAASLPLSMG